MLVERTVSLPVPLDAAGLRTPTGPLSRLQWTMPALSHEMEVARYASCIPSGACCFLEHPQGAVLSGTAPAGRRSCGFDPGPGRLKGGPHHWRPGSLNHHPPKNVLAFFDSLATGED